MRWFTNALRAVSGDAPRSPLLSEHRLLAGADHAPGSAAREGLGVRLVTVRSAPSREAFKAWREHPVTEFVFAALRTAAEAQQQAWQDASWQGGVADQELLNELRVRADAYKALEDGGYEAFCEWAGVEPQSEEQ